jgi:hypothetical protein
MLKVLLTIFGLCHIFACLFLTIAIKERQNDPLRNVWENTWMEKANISSQKMHWFTKYLYALYFVVTTMITVGYGDSSINTL